MKKLAIGCLIVLVIGGAAVAGVVYYAYRQVRSTVAQFAELGQVPEIERGIRAQGGFEPPASEELTDTQIEKLVRVQTAIKQRLGQRFSDFERKYKTLADKKEATVRDLPTLFAAYRDMVAAWIDAKRAQVDALNDVGFSLEEYRWIRDQSYRALGMAYVDFDLGKLAKNIERGVDVDQPGRLLGAVEPTGPEINRKLVERFKKQLEESIALASFGL
jgi:hypothetical protein